MRTSSSTRRAARAGLGTLGDGDAGAPDTLDDMLVRVGRGCLEPDERGVVRRPLGDEEAMDPVVVARRRGAIRRRLARDEPDDVGEELTERGRVGPLRDRGRRVRDRCSCGLLLGGESVRIVPIPSMVETSSSPGARNRGGVRVALTRQGVPVKMRSPGSNGVTDESRWISVSAPKIRSEVRLFCTSSLFTVEPSSRSSGFASRLGDHPGPVGPKPGKAAEVNCGAGGRVCTIRRRGLGRR